MTKETILAIIAGFAIGLLAAWGLWKSSQKPTVKETAVTAPTQTPALKPTFSLNLTSPENEFLATEAVLTVSGKTTEPATVVITNSVEEKVSTTKEDGSFTTTLNLQEGTDEIAVTAYNQKNEEITEIRTVNYTKEGF